MKCDHCGRQLDTLSHTCSRCGEEFCTEHRLPESHDCVGLKVEKAEREIKRKEGEEVPWFDDDVTSSSESDNTTARVERSVSGTSTITEQDTETTDRYRETHASHECSTCSKLLFEHEASACPYCGDVYCGGHLDEHRPYCDERDEEEISSTKTVSKHYQKRTEEEQKERTTRREQLEKERKERYSSPDVNLDGSLNEAEYEEDIESLSSDQKQSIKSGSGNRLWLTLLLVGLLAAIVAAVFLI